MASESSPVSDRACCADSGIVPIKRYPNRRFYDRKSSKYITLQEIEELVRGGHTIEVRDSKNDEDLTRVVLTQILVERYPERMDLFPIPMLHMILQANDLALEFFRVFLRLSMATLESFQGSRTLAPFGSPFDWMRMFFPGFAPAPGPRQLAGSPEASVEQLSQRVAELEARIKQLESGPTAAPERESLPGPRHPSAPGPEDRSSR